MKKLFLAACLIAGPLGLMAQHMPMPNDRSPLPDYIYIPARSSDTLFGTVDNIGRIGGRIEKLDFTDTKGVKTELSGAQACELVKSLRINGIQLDLVPLKPEKPDGYLRHKEIDVAGRITLYDEINVYAITDKGKRDMYIVAWFGGAARKSVKLPNGQYRPLNKTTKKELYALFNACSGFKYDEKTAISVLIDRYNKECK